MKPIVTALITVSLALNTFFAYKVLRGDSTTHTSHSTGEMVVMRTPGGLLEVSTISTDERFDSTSNHSVLSVPLGRTVAQVKVPAVYRYHIPLAKDWSFNVAGNSLIVVAPTVEPSLPVAIDTGKLESLSSGLWSPITGTDAVAALQKSISANLAEKSITPQFLLLQRESARKTVSEFVQKWVVDQPRWKGMKSPAIFVFFEDEPLGKRAMPLFSELRVPLGGV